MPTREEYFRDLEISQDVVLDRDLYHVIRVDGRAFHTVTKDMVRPADSVFMERMDTVAEYMCGEIQGAKLGFVQSDEISILVTSFGFKSQMWFGGLLRKWLSISAGMASSIMSTELGRPVQFDSRVLSLTRQDVIRYFLWRQGDCARNAIQAAAQHHIGHKNIHGSDRAKQLQQLQAAGINFADQYSQGFRNGRVIKPENAKYTATWTHKKTGELNSIEVDRQVWTSQEAPWFDWDTAGFLDVNVPLGPIKEQM